MLNVVVEDLLQSYSIVLRKWMRVNCCLLLLPENSLKEQLKE